VLRNDRFAFLYREGVHFRTILLGYPQRCEASRRAVFLGMILVFELKFTAQRAYDVVVGFLVFRVSRRNFR
jgi:hypothetical protein